MHPCIASILQLAALYLMGAVMVLCAYLGYTVTATILEVRSCCQSDTPVKVLLMLQLLTSKNLHSHTTSFCMSVTISGPCPRSPGYLRYCTHRGLV